MKTGNENKRTKRKEIQFSEAEYTAERADETHGQHQL